MTMIILCIVLGVISFAFAQIISVSQIVSFFKTRNTSGVSIWTYVIFVVAGIVCLVWGFSYYFQEMTKEASEELTNNPSFYTLYQWTIIPIISYYITDFCLSLTMLIIKTRHIILSKKLKIDELELADYLKDHTSKKYIKSKKKLYYHPNFIMIAVLSALGLFVILFMVCFSCFVRPTVTHPADWSGFSWVMPTSLTAALLWEAISWPQFIKSIRQKDTSGISMNWAIFMPVALTVSFTYALALALKSGEFSADTIGALIFNGMIVNYGILVIKILNKKSAKTMGLTELEYTRKVLIPQYKAKQAAKAQKGAK